MIINKLTSLAISRSMCAIRFTDFILSDFGQPLTDNMLANDENRLKSEYWGRCQDIIAMTLNIKSNYHKNIYDIGIGDDGFLIESKIVTFALETIMKKNSIDEELYEIYGSDYANYYRTVLFFMLLKYLSSIFEYEDILNDPKVPKNEKFIKELSVASYFIKELSSDFIQDNLLLIEKYYPLVIQERVHLLEIELDVSADKFDYKKINNACTRIIESIYSNYELLNRDISNAISLIDELKSCKVGYHSWKKYENTCTKITQFLFIPPHKRLFFQVNNDSKHQRRDVIIPNYQTDGFWKSIKDEFSSKNIVFEFKNGKDANREKSSINQLRIYLSKPTIGKFGFLFLRNKPEKTLLEARKNAYEESGILILILHDKLVEDMILLKTVLGSCEDIIESEKINFELAY